MRDRIVRFSTTYPKTTLGLILLATALFAAQLPKIKTDTDPKHMLPATSPVRVYNDQVERWFGLHKERAGKSEYVFYLMALSALAAWMAHRKSHPSAKPLTWLALALALFSVNLAGWISQAGGQVRHSEFREGPP